MGKHNGKARKAGSSKVGAALVARSRNGGEPGKITGPQQRHTTDFGDGKNMQSVLDRSDLDELMAMADLAERDFTAERTHVVVISTGAVDPVAQQAAAAERAAAEARNAHRLKLPRRPAWDAETTPEQLDLAERTSFLAWRRELAFMEESEHLVLTPFEKNLEVWRQLWRVLERSDVVVQVVDARDPLLYRSPDLEAYCRELCATKHSLVLLNKADLLPLWARQRWADHFDKAGVRYAFWSAHAAIQQQAKQRAEAAALGVHPSAIPPPPLPEEYRAGSDPRVRVLDADELMTLFEAEARAAVAAAPADDPRHQDTSRRLMVGLVGYPNVGKSSTINALFGSKKTAVAPTPGKTKHFQTLNVSPAVTLCDCPGLVLPRFAKAKAEMVAAGVIPIDRLSDVRAPVGVVVRRIGRLQPQAVYKLRVPPPQPGVPQTEELAAAALLRAFATLRGWTSGSGLPDETRAGRQILRDYADGKLLYCVLPPDSDPPGWAPDYDPQEPPPGASTAPPPPAASSSGRQQGSQQASTDEALPGGSSVGTAAAAASASEPAGLARAQGASSSSSRAAAPAAAIAQHQGGQQTADGEDSATDGSEDGEGSDSGLQGAAAGAPALAYAAAAGAASSRGTMAAAGAAAAEEGQLSAADLDLLGVLGLGAGKAARQKRAEHKFHKKAARSKGNRGEDRAEGAFDGAAMTTGKKGGLVRVGGYV